MKKLLDDPIIILYMILPFLLISIILGIIAITKVLEKKDVCITFTAPYSLTEQQVKKLYGQEQSRNNTIFR